MPLNAPVSLFVCAHSLYRLDAQMFGVVQTACNATLGARDIASTGIIHGTVLPASGPMTELRGRLACATLVSCAGYNPCTAVMMSLAS